MNFVVSMIFEISSFEIQTFEIWSIRDMVDSRYGRFEISSFEIQTFEIWLFEIWSFEIHPFEIKMCYTLGVMAGHSSPRGSKFQS